MTLMKKAGAPKRPRPFFTDSTRRARLEANADASGNLKPAERQLLVGSLDRRVGPAVASEPSNRHRPNRSRVVDDVLDVGAEVQACFGLADVLHRRRQRGRGLGDRHVADRVLTDPEDRRTAEDADVELLG